MQHGLFKCECTCRSAHLKIEAAAAMARLREQMAEQELYKEDPAEVRAKEVRHKQGGLV